MDIMAMAGMIFSLLVVLIIGGLILLFPISRRLGRFLEIRIDEKMEWDELPKDAFNEMMGAFEELQTEVSRLRDRQQFIERLLEPGRSADTEGRTPDGNGDGNG